MLKAQREILLLQAKMADLQKQYDAAVAAVRQQQEQMQAACITGAAQAKVDISQFTCDADKLVFIPRTPPPE